MAEKLDYTIQIDEQEYDVTAADALHADLANQVEKALIVKESVRKNLNYKEPGSTTELKNIESLTVDDLQADIETPNTNIGVVDSRDTRVSESNGHSFAYKGDFDTTLEVVPSSGGVFTGPIYAPDIDAGDGFNINKFQVTNYNSIDTIIRELKGFPVYEWTGTQVRALTEGNPPTMLPFKVIIYTGPTSGDTDYWTETARANLRLVNCAPDGITTDCTTDGNFFLINAKAGHLDCGRILLGTFDHTKTTNCSTYVELRVKEADHADNATNADTLDTTDGKGSVTQPIYLAEGNDGGVATACYERAGGTAVTLNGTNSFDDGESATPTTSASFYAPEDGGTEPKAATATKAAVLADVLLSAGNGNAPTWASQDTLSVKEAQKITEYIRDVDIDEIFVQSDGKITSEVLNAYNVTGAIQGTEIGDIFNYKTIGTVTSIFEVKQAAKATNADNADISDKLFIYPVGGTSNSPIVGTPTASGNYIYYGENTPNDNAGTEDFRRTGNIYIKIES